MALVEKGWKKEQESQEYARQSHHHQQICCLVAGKSCLDLMSRDIYMAVISTKKKVVVHIPNSSVTVLVVGKCEQPGVPRAIDRAVPKARLIGSHHYYTHHLTITSLSPLQA